MKARLSSCSRGATCGSETQALRVLLRTPPPLGSWDKAHTTSPSPQSAILSTV